jgi:peptide/nickel transport system permease protein
VIERLFNYQGLGLLILNAGQRKDFPLLQGAVLLIGVMYIVLTLLADVLQAALNPRVRAQVASG